MIQATNIYCYIVSYAQSVCENNKEICENWIGSKTNISKFNGWYLFAWAVCGLNKIKPLRGKFHILSYVTYKFTHDIYICTHASSLHFIYSFVI